MPPEKNPPEPLSLILKSATDVLQIQDSNCFIPGRNDFPDLRCVVQNYPSGLCKQSIDSGHVYPTIGFDNCPIYRSSN